MTSPHNHPRLWTPEEDAILCRYYPSKGYRACIKYLPEHSAGSIENRGRKLGLRSLRGPLSQAELAGRRRKAQATRQRRMANPERAERLCLGVCGLFFTSEWVGHRMCRSCRERAIALG